MISDVFAVNLTIVTHGCRWLSTLSGDHYLTLINAACHNEPLCSN